MVKLLVKKGADPRVKDDGGATALDLAKDEETREILKKEIKYAEGEGILPKWKVAESDMGNTKQIVSVYIVVYLCDKVKDVSYVELVNLSQK